MMLYALWDDLLASSFRSTFAMLLQDIRGMPPTFARDAAGNWESPCSPRTKRFTDSWLTPMRCASAILSLLESRTVPEPKTCDIGSPEHSCATYVRASQGLETTMILAVGLIGFIPPMTAFMIPAFALMRSSRVSPSRWPLPAVITMMSACPASCGVAISTRPSPSSRSRTSPRHFSWLTSVIVTRPATAAQSRAKAVLVPTKPAPMTATWTPFKRSVSGV
mmetsp:Transcript_51273/g.158884  ORF Transcript_51273/g.158884 Transcript_51273/m.158884 type:complete len:221 (+) Transcript_51273:466-1128(+)